MKSTIIKMKHNEDYRKKLGRTLFRLRNQSNYHVSDVAAFINLSRSSLVNIECGRQTASLQTVAQLARIYGKSLEELIEAAGESVYGQDFEERREKLNKRSQSRKKEALLGSYKKLEEAIAKKERELQQLLEKIQNGDI